VEARRDLETEKPGDLALAGQMVDSLKGEVGRQQGGSCGHIESRSIHMGAFGVGNTV